MPQSLVSQLHAADLHPDPPLEMATLKWNKSEKMNTFNVVVCPATELINIIPQAALPDLNPVLFPGVHVYPAYCGFCTVCIVN